MPNERDIEIAGSSFPDLLRWRGCRLRALHRDFQQMDIEIAGSSFPDLLFAEMERLPTTGITSRFPTNADLWLIWGCQETWRIWMQLWISTLQIFYDVAGPSMDELELDIKKTKIILDYKLYYSKVNSDLKLFFHLNIDTNKHK